MSWDISDPDVVSISPKAYDEAHYASQFNQTSPRETRSVRMQVGSGKCSQISQTDDINPTGGKTEGVIHESCLSPLLVALAENVKQNSSIVNRLAPQWEFSGDVGVTKTAQFDTSSPITAVTWSVSGILAVAFGSSNCPDFPDANKISFYRQESKLREVDVPTLCTSLSFKPNSNVLAGGSATGDVVIYNYDTNEIVVTSGSHREAVTQVRWIARDNTSLLASLSAEGRLVFWSFPLFSPVSSIPLIGPGRRSLTSRCFDFHSFEFMVGCETGQTARASNFSDISKSPKLKEAEGTPGYVGAVAFSPCGRYVAVCGGMELKIFGQNIKPNFVFTSSTATEDLAWSSRPGVLALGTRSCAHLFDFSRELKLPVLNLDGSITSLSFGALGNLAVGEVSGKLRVLRLGSEWGGKYSLENYPILFHKQDAIL